MVVMKVSLSIVIRESRNAIRLSSSFSCVEDKIDSVSEASLLLRTWFISLGTKKKTARILSIKIYNFQYSEFVIRKKIPC